MAKHRIDFHARLNDNMMVSGHYEEEAATTTDAINEALEKFARELPPEAIITNVSAYMAKEADPFI